MLNSNYINLGIGTTHRFRALSRNENTRERTFDKNETDPTYIVREADIASRKLCICSEHGILLQG